MDRLASMGWLGKPIIVLCGHRPEVSYIRYDEARDNYIIAGNVADRLYAYEDTGLTSEEIEQLKEENARLHMLLDDIENKRKGSDFMAKAYKCDICGKSTEELGAVYLGDKYQSIFKDAHSERVFDICIDCAHELQKVIYERSANSEYRK